MRQRPLPQGTTTAQPSPARHPPPQQPPSQRAPQQRAQGGHHHQQHQHPSRSLSPPPVAPSGPGGTGPWEKGSGNFGAQAAHGDDDRGDARRDRAAASSSAATLAPPRGLRGPLHDAEAAPGAAGAAAPSSASSIVVSAAYLRHTLLSSSKPVSSSAYSYTYHSDPDLPGCNSAADDYHYPKRYYQNGEVHFRKTGNRRRTRPEDFHTVYRTPHHVPDRKFREYLLGRPAATATSAAATLTSFGAPSPSDDRRRGRSSKRKEAARVRPPMITEEAALRAGLGFSAVGAAFLAWVGVLLDAQPLYVRGALPVLLVAGPSGRAVARHVLPDPTGGGAARLAPARAAYRAALAYLLVAILCWYRLNRGWVHSRIWRRRDRYEDIPDPLARRRDYGENDNGGDDEALPLFDRRHQEGSSSTTAYQIGLGSRVKATVLRWLALRGWFYYRPAQRLRRKREPKCV